jgi:AraC-like DNA-binding protein
VLNTATIPWDFRTPDLAVIRRVISGVLKPFCLEADSDGEFDARICHRRLVNTELTVIDYGNATIVDAGRLERFYVIHIPLRGDYWFERDGQPLRIGKGQVHIVHPDVPLRMRVSSTSRLLVLRSTDSRLQELEAQLARSGRGHGTVISCREGAGASLGRAVEFVSGELFHGNLLHAGTAIASAAESLLLDAIIHGMRGARSSANRARPAYVRRAEDYILGNLRSELPIEAIVAAARVSRRSLFRSFRAEHGSSPMRWARSQRLRRIRADLSDPSQAGRTISAVASHWGITHFGHFCEAYRHLHGETPGETRQLASSRLQDDGPAS